ncbi:MFS transporter [Bdellovibrio bacteriovorus]|nr:MFS transporter [Bdellovibrio bacteriovorus]
MDKYKYETTVKGLWDVTGMVSLGVILVFYCYYLTGILHFETSQTKESSSGLSVVASYLSFATGFIFRPLGAIYFGALADTAGKKRALVKSFKMLGVVSLCMALLHESYMPANVVSVFVIIVRLLQGFATAGTVTCAIAYIYDLAPTLEKGRFTSWLQMAAPSGYLIAMAIVILFKLFVSAEDLGIWGWRVCFLLSGLIYPLAVYIDRKFPDVPLTYDRETSAISHLKNLLSDKSALKRIFTFALFIAINVGVLAYFFNLYRLYFLGPLLKVPSDAIGFIVAISSLFLLPLYPLFGVISDRVGRTKMCLAGAFLGIAVIFPYFYFMQKFAGVGGIGANKAALIIIMVLTGFVITLSYAPVVALVCDSVEPRYRAVSFGVIYNIGFSFIPSLLQIAGSYFYDKNASIYGGIYAALIVATLAGGISYLIRPKRTTA